MATAALVLDLDGTVWDSFPFYSSILEPFAGRSAAEIHQELLDGGNIVRLLESCPGIGKAGFERRIRERADDLRFYPGVVSTLDTLSECEMHIGVLTSLPRWVARPMLESTQLESRFNTIVDGSSVHRKPSAAALVAALPEDEVGIEPSDTTYVGDSEIDALTARAYGARFAWASYGYGESPSYVTTTLTSFVEVLEL